MGMNNVRVVDMAVVPSRVKKNCGRPAQIFALMLDSLGKAVEADIATKGELRSLVKSVKHLGEKEGHDVCWERDKDWSHCYFWIPKREGQG
jgi:hypothetical protein